MPVMDVRSLQDLLTSVDAPYAVESVTESGVRLRLAVAEAHIRPGGTVSGPALMALADAVAWSAVLVEIGPVVAAVSTSLHIDFLRKPQAIDVLADGVVMKLGKTLAVIDVAMRSSGVEELVAKAQVTYTIRPRIRARPKGRHEPGRARPPRERTARRSLVPGVGLRHILPVDVTAKPVNDDGLVLCLGQLPGTGVSRIVVSECAGLDLLPTGK